MSDPLAVGRAIGRREGAERAAKLLRALVARWQARIAARGFILGPMLAELTRGFVADLETEAVAIENALPLLVAEERRLTAELEQNAAAQKQKRKHWWKK